MGRITSPNVVSFVIRFVQEGSPSPDRSQYRGVIRHVQNDQEVVFTSWDHAVEFIQQFVPISPETDTGDFILSSD